MKESTTIAAKQRMYYLDNLKVLMIIFVVIMHAACTYSGIGSWYYHDHTTLSDDSFYTFLVYQSFSQAYFMSMYFFIAGYFIPSSLEKKGREEFISNRMSRLGIPTLIYIFVINPVCLKMVHPGQNFLDIYWSGLVTGQFIGWTGPLWFALVLLIFSIIFAFLKKWWDTLLRFSFDITFKNIVILIAVITVCAFTLRVIFPFGTAIFNIQLANFSAYTFMFLLGTLARKKGILDKITYKIGKICLAAAFILGVPLWIVVIRSVLTTNALTNELNVTLIGGWDKASFLYTFWESFFCVSIIIAFIGIFKELFNSQNSLQKFLSDNCFGIYVFHTPILIITSISLKGVVLAPVLKWVAASVVAVVATVIFSWLIRKNLLLRKIFS